MTSRLLLPALLLVVFSSCATYRSGYTPDDVYYSPEREREQYTVYEEESSEDIRLRQQIRDSRFRQFDDDFYFNRPGINSNWNQFGIISNNPFFMPGQPFAIIPGTTFVITNPVPVQPGKTGPRYIPSISSISQNQNWNNGGNGKFNLPTNTNRGNGSRFFGGATNSSRQSNSGMPFQFNMGTGGSGSRFFNSGGSSGGSSSGSSGRTLRGRKN